MAERQRQVPPPEPAEDMEVDVQEEQYTPPEAPQRPRRATRQYPTPPPPAPSTERVRIEDAEYDVPPAVAAQVRSWEQAQARLDAIERSHQQTEQWRQGVERAVSGEQPQPQDEIEQLWFTNPSEAARRLQERTVQQVESRYEAQQREQRFWGTFEQEHPELATQRTLVQYLLSTDQTIATLPNSPEGRAQLAQAARERVLGWMQGMRGSGQAPRGQQVAPVETGTRRRSPAAPRQERPEGPQSLKELQEMRSLQRRQARLRIVGNG
jgi:hypothetical protein